MTEQVTAFRAFMGGAIDYAGMFPPEELPAGEAFGNYTRYRSGPEAWMLGRFVIRGSGILKMVPHHLSFRQGDKPLRMAVIGKGGETRDEFPTNVRDALDTFIRLQQDYSRSVVMEMFEVRLPPTVVSACSTKDLISLFDETANMIESRELSLTPSYEVGLTPKWSTEVVTVILALAIHNNPSGGRQRKHCRPAGFKLRCGGKNIPSVEQVALAITACRDAKICMKATAGLHQPIRDFDGGTHKHGFLNVIGACLLAHAHNLDEEAVRGIIGDEVSANFVFEPDVFGWGDRSISVDEIRAARESAFVSFGSCSFEEPVKDLRSLGLL